MEDVIEKNKCTGCTACMNICPQSAITMIIDEDGFKYPKIDKSKCINCGLCRKICPVINTTNNISLNKCYVAYNNDSEARKEASSGGIFELIANIILEKNGIVIGAAFDKNNDLKHTAIENKKNLKQLKSSKYLQSDLDNIFKYIQENIEKKEILFVGTPCQVAGLKAFLKKDYGNLICIDLVCHGVPSPKLFKKYINELETKHNDKVINYNFRDKITGWDTYSNTVHFTKSTITELQTNNNYMKLFLSDVALRDSCYNCNFKLGNKYSDITLGDFWGVKNYYPKMYNKEGVSAIIINTEKGKDVLLTIKNNMVFKECNLNEILNGNPSLKLSSKKSENRNEFFKELDTMNVEKLTKKYQRKIPLYRQIIGKVRRLLCK